MIPNPPIQTWEQAGIIVLFCVLLAALFGGLFAGGRMLVINMFQQITGIFDQFQKFLDKQDSRWQDYFEKRETSFDARNAALVDVLNKLAEKMDSHDDAMRKAIATMEERTRPIPKTRVTK